MIRILHTADLHLGAAFPTLGAREQQRREDFLATFTRIVDLAIAEKVELVLVAGDLFDRCDPDSGLVGFVQGAFARLDDAGIGVVLLPGTHDHQLAGTGVYRRENFPTAVLLTDVQVATPVKLRVGREDVYLYGFAAGVAEEPAALLAGMRRRFDDGLHVGLLHGSLEGSPEWDYRGKDLPFALTDLQDWDLDYLALGHYHRFQELSLGGRLYGCYPGSPEGKRFGENGPRYVLLVEIGPRTASVRPVEIQTRKLVEKTIELEAGITGEAVARMVEAAADCDDLVRLRLHGTLERALDIDWLTGRCRSAFFHLDLVDETRWLSDERLDELAREESVRGECVRRFRKLLRRTDDDEQRREIEQALREILVRFRIVEGR
ncbi:exonuclease SbcD [Geothermobacter ehrlichii]|uniref:Exonuclease SbcD n=1 Tax=Geothermobacter ehrlichii TaxID=213224 RepID=A0A5D3WNX5_9BACT|nr:DNA repair exonuclease [Geothermobacter ehrlichii]TYP00235.1 exonuclease SbcD [Geothermobacter ehrlichii]